MKHISRWLALTIAATLTSLIVYTVAAEPQAPGAVPTQFVAEQASALVLKDGSVYWTTYDGCPLEGEFPSVCQVRAKPTGGGSIRTLYANLSLNSTTDIVFNSLAVDDTYVYWSERTGQIKRLSRNATTAETPDLIVSRQFVTTTITQVAVDSSYLYWVENYNPVGSENDKGYLFRKPKAAGATQQMERFDWVITQMQADGVGGIYYISSRLFSDLLLHTYESTTPGIFITDNASAVFVQAYTFNETTLYWADRSSGPVRIRRAPRNDISNAAPALHTLDNTGDPVVRAMTVDGTNLYWHEYRSTFPVGGPIYRRPHSGGPPQPITDDYEVDVKNLTVVGTRLFWFNGQGIFILPTDAAPVTFDLLGNFNLEVVQALQNPAHDIPLVAGKETYVRAYGRIGTSSAGLTRVTLRPVVQLFGTRDGAPLPESPLSPLTNLPLSSDLIDRTNLDNDFLFRLPPSWTQGTVTLRAEINPRRAGSLIETDYTNNSNTRTVTFNRKQTLCLDMIPVETTAGTIGASDPVFGGHFRRAASIWPVDRFLVVWRGGPPHRRPNVPRLLDPLNIFGSGPYTMFGDPELVYLLFNLTFDFMFSAAPPHCQGLHTVRTAMVASSSRYGMSNAVAPIIYFLRDDGGATAENRPIGGNRGLAHELGHQQGRAHVNCGGPASPDGGYPYAPCTIGNVGPNSFIGFDVISRKLLLPESTADFMSYGPEPLWASDYTYRALFNSLRDSSLARQSDPLHGTSLAAVEQLAVSGLISGTPGTAFLNFAYRVDGATLAEMQNKIATSTQLTTTYELRTYNANGAQLTSAPLNVIPLETEGGKPATVFFNLLAPDPAIARIEVAYAGTPIGSRIAGSNAPTINITSPSAGSNITNVLAIAWTGSDADGDGLMYTVRYSNDNGTTWKVLGSQTSSTSLAVDMTNGLPGGARALLQVIASDGLHSTSSTVGPFTVQTHAPSVTILDDEGNALNLTMTAAAPQRATVLLHASAYDAEDGNLTAAALQWTIAGPITRTGSGEQIALSHLSPGTYQVTLTATDSEGRQSVANTRLTISPKRVFDGPAPTLDGQCDDAAYASELDPLTLRYDATTDPSNAQVHFVHADAALYVCFVGLPIGLNEREFVGVKLDLNHSGDNAQQPDDVTFYVQKDGRVQTGRGDGSGELSDTTPQGLQAIVSVGDISWSAEMRIAETSIGGWNRSVRMWSAHLSRNGADDDAGWPRESAYNVPNTWGATALGQLVQTIDFAALQNRVMGEQPFAIHATPSSGLPPRFRSLTEQVCRIDGNLVTLLAAGTCTIRASQPGDDSFGPAVEVEQSFTVAAPQYQVHLPLVIR